jgi:hypothetical protein
MSERSHPSSDPAMAEALVAARAHIDWPTTPDVAQDVGASIRAMQAKPALVAPRLSMPSRRRTLIAIAAALLLVAGVAFAARLVIELGAVAVQVLPDRPTSLPTNVATPDDLGREVTLAEAEATAGFQAALPAALGPPDRTWVDEAAVGFEPGDVARRIVNAWAPATGLPVIPGTEAGAVLMQFEGDWEVASKLLSAETDRFGEAIVEGRPAFWTSGEHELRLVSGDETARLLVTGNVLIWQDAGYTFRLETFLAKRAAIVIAESIDPVLDLG